MGTVMRIYFRKSIFAILVSFAMYSGVGLAAEATCAEWLKNDFIVDVAYLTINPLFWPLALFMSPSMVRQGRDIAALNAATGITNGELSDKERIAAHRWIDFYTQKIKQQIPNFSMDKDEVIAELHDFNIRSTSTGECRRLLTGSRLRQDAGLNLIATIFADKGDETQQ